MYGLGTAIAANRIYGGAVPKIPSRGAAVRRWGGVFSAVKTGRGIPRKAGVGGFSSFLNLFKPFYRLVDNLCIPLLAKVSSIFFAVLLKLF